MQTLNKGETGNISNAEVFTLLYEFVSRTRLSSRFLGYAVVKYNRARAKEIGVLGEGTSALRVRKANSNGSFPQPKITFPQPKKEIVCPLLF